MKTPSHIGKKRVVKAFAVLQDEGEGWLPVALTFKLRTLLMENISRNIKTQVVPCEITYSLPKVNKKK